MDVLVFLDAPVAVGCVLTVRLIGVIEAKQRKKGEQWIRNDRLLAVATHAHTHQHVETLDDLRPHLADEIEAFFQHYNAMKGSDFKPVNRGTAAAQKRRANSSIGPRVISKEARAEKRRSVAGRLCHASNRRAAERSAG